MCLATAPVVLKLAKGHTPGHQVLYLKLAKTGGVVLSGDLYHYPQERTLNRLPTFEFNVDQTRESRQAIDAFLKKTGAQLWISTTSQPWRRLRRRRRFTTSRRCESDPGRCKQLRASVQGDFALGANWLRSVQWVRSRRVCDRPSTHELESSSNHQH
jgi:glyoxylase-like metal-dependent hydrolase (beta-lactamase superfamily II)